VVIAAGLGWTAPAVVGVGLAAVGLVALTASALLRRRERVSGPVRTAPAPAR
jgi:DHA1 family inner membrane transport protein